MATSEPKPIVRLNLLETKLSREVSEAIAKKEEDARRRYALKKLIHMVKYLLGYLQDYRIVYEIKTGRNPFEVYVKVYWKEEEPKEPLEPCIFI